MLLRVPDYCRAAAAAAAVHIPCRVRCDATRSLDEQVDDFCSPRPLVRVLSVRRRAAESLRLQQLEMTDSTRRSDDVNAASRTFAHLAYLPSLSQFITQRASREAALQPPNLDRMKSPGNRTRSWRKGGLHFEVLLSAEKMRSVTETPGFKNKQLEFDLF